MSFSSLLRIQTRVFFLFTLFFSIFHSARAIGVQITQPPQDSTLTAGSQNVSWIDAGGSPDMGDLTEYKLELIVGGNLGAQDSTVVQTLVKQGPVSTGRTTVNISSSAAQSIQNGFYLRMTSNATDGRTVLNYSGRFTLIQMTGKTDAIYVQGAAASVGGSNVPAAQVNVPVPAPSSAQSSSTSNSNSLASSDPSSSSSSSNNGSPSSAIGTGAIIGVAVVGVIVGISLVAMSWWIWAMQKRRQRRRQEQHTQPDSAVGYTGGKAELPSHSADSSVASTPPVSTTESVELADRRASAKAFEMSANEHDLYAEVEGPPIVHELEGEWTGWELPGTRRSKYRSYDPTR